MHHNEHQITEQSFSNLLLTLNFIIINLSTPLISVKKNEIYNMLLFLA